MGKAVQAHPAAEVERQRRSRDDERAVAPQRPLLQLCRRTFRTVMHETMQWAWTLQERALIADATSNPHNRSGAAMPATAAGSCLSCGDAVQDGRQDIGSAIETLSRAVHTKCAKTRLAAGCGS